MKYSEENLRDKTILITGGAGFIGANLAFYFQKNHPEAKIVVFDRFRSEKPSLMATSRVSATSKTSSASKEK